MSSEIDIYDDGNTSLDLTIRANGTITIGLCCDVGHEFSYLDINFDLKDEKQREAIKVLISHLQHQIDIAEEK